VQHDVPINDKAQQSVGGTESVGGSAAVTGGSSSVTGGTTSTGGASASGGSSTGGTSTGGSGGTGGGTGGTGTGGSGGGSGGSGGTLVITDGFGIEYSVLSGDASSSTISCQLDIVNSGSETVPLAEMTVRYYYTSEVTVATTIDVNWAGLNPGFTDLAPSLTGQAVPMDTPVANADSYVEFGFSGGAPAIAPGETASISWQIRASDWSMNFTQTDDYSFDASKTSAEAWDHVVLLHNGSAIWGEAL
jgi:hypothetical protein